MFGLCIVLSLWFCDDDDGNDDGTTLWWRQRAAVGVVVANVVGGVCWWVGCAQTVKLLHRCSASLSLSNGREFMRRPPVCAFEI